MLKTNWYKIAEVVMLAFIFLMGANVYAQDSTMSPSKNDTQSSDTYKQNAKKWTDQLDQKLSLTQEQQTRIQGILVDYQQANQNISMDKRNQLQLTYDTRIESVLNDNQKSMYESYKDEWWKGISMPSKDSNSGY